MKTDKKQKQFVKNLNSKSEKQESVAKQIQAFLDISGEFKLGHLVTERPHLKTQNLSQDSQLNIPQALESLHEVDSEILETLLLESENLFELHQTLQHVLAQGNKVYMSGCGATGRLSLVLETLKKQIGEQGDQTIGFMAGGD